ncbi:MAG: DNA cytosine methyltransferase, partial [Clostridiales bacterium]|nr:DNA cytosine methyltransferase [Clostridiales bacterium]
MINVATVFSGIGAAEQALKQMKANYRIAFACDNGERYLNQTQEEINDILKNFSPEYREKVIGLLYDSTGKPNNVKKSYFANYDIDDSRWFEDIRFLDGKPYKGEIDLFIGGAPCQSFSTYGH